MADVECFYFEEVVDGIGTYYVCHSLFPGQEGEGCENCPANTETNPEGGEELLQELLG